MKGRKSSNVVSMGATGGVPRPPAWLSPSGKAEWVRAAADLNGRGLLFPGALASLGLYCSCVAAAQSYQTMLAEQGPMQEDGTPNPALKAMLAAAAQARLYAAELGLSVTSRSRAATAQQSDQDGWGELGVG